MKQLFLIRHGKSCWDDETLNDFDRPLNKRGLRNTPFMADVLKNDQITPDLIISSGANRALSTAKIMAVRIGFDKEKIVVNNNIYDATKDDLIDVIRNIDDNVNTLFLVGHNPSLNEFANYFVDFEDNIATCSVLGIGFDANSWNDIKECESKQIFYDYPRRYD
jgi:phosphohistidine phosphatase